MLDAASFQMGCAMTEISLPILKEIGALFYFLMNIMARMGKDASEGGCGSEN